MRMRWALPMVLCASAAAHAWPVDHAIELAPGAERFEKLAAVDWVDVEHEQILSAEVLPSGELLLTGKSEGRTHLLLYVQGKFAVWRVDVGRVPAPDASSSIDAAAKACGTKAEPMKAAASSGAALSVPVRSDECRRALLGVFDKAFLARNVEIVYDLPVLQAQLSDLQQAFKAAGLERLSARYKGAGLVLEGKTTTAERKRALWIVFRRSVGRVPLDDQTEVTDKAMPEAEAAPPQVDEP